MRRLDARVDRRRTRAARGSVRRRVATHRGRAAGCRPPGVLARRSRRSPTPARHRRASHAAVRRSHPTAEGRRPRGALSRRARRPVGRARRRRRTERERRRARAARACVHSPTTSESAPGSAGCGPSATIGSPTTTAPPTCAWCRPAPSRSGWLRSKPPRAGRRSLPPTWAGCARSSITTRRVTSSKDATPADYAGPVEKLLAFDRDPRRDGVECRGALAALLVEHDRRALATALRRPRRTRARSLRLSVHSTPDSPIGRSIPRSGVPSTT